MQDDDLQIDALSRRDALIWAGVALTPWLCSSARAGDPDAAPPQPGDHLVFLTGPNKGQPIRADALPEGGAQVQAYPADPTGMIRNGSRLNLVIVARVGTDGVSEETRAHMADGVVAYSGICTHQACPVNMWSSDRHAFVCSCHASVYDPKNGAEVLAGPAPQHLAALPLKSENGVLTVAAGFVGRVGMQTS